MLVSSREVRSEFSKSVASEVMCLMFCSNVVGYLLWEKDNAFLILVEKSFFSGIEDASFMSDATCL